MKKDAVRALAKSVLPIASCLLVVACGGAPVPVAHPEPVETLESHARAHDAEGIRRAVAAIRGNAVADRLRGLAALLEYEPVALQPLLPLLAERALHGETPAERAAAAWALVQAGDGRVASSALAAYDAGTLQKVTRLDGAVAFDVVALARLLATTTVAPSENEARRRVIASALPSADTATRPLLVRSLAEDAGDAAPLVAAAEALDPKRDFLAIEGVLRRVRELADPRAADALAHYADHVSAPYFRTEAAILLAELGDLRSAPHLAWRMGADSERASADDRERVLCARMLGELALEHPEALARLRELAEGPVTAWMQARPQPHANALRFLALSGSPRAPALLAALADPKTPLPAVGAQPPMPEEFVVAQSALRWLGATHDASAWPILLKQLGRKPASFDASMDSLMAGGKAIAGMTYRSLVWGAADGLAELGDPKAVPALVKVADDPKQNDQARIEACRAASLLADPRARAEIVARVRRSATDRKAELARSCWLSGLAANPHPADAPSIVALLAPKVDSESRHQAARLLGVDGLDPRTRDKVEALLKDKHLVHDAALALLFGGDEGSIAKVFAAYVPSGPGEGALPPMAALRQLYATSVPTLDDGLYASGALARMVTLARAARAAHQDWVLQGLAYQLRQTGAYDVGPRTLTRGRLRAKLLADARGSDEKKRDDALLVLWALGERAALQSLGPLAATRLTEPSP